MINQIFEFFFSFFKNSLLVWPFFSNMTKFDLPPPFYPFLAFRIILNLVFIKEGICIKNLWKFEENLSSRFNFTLTRRFWLRQNLDVRERELKIFFLNIGLRAPKIFFYYIKWPFWAFLVRMKKLLGPTVMEI